MAHLVEKMFSVKQAPWHRLGIIIEDAPTIEQGIIMAGLNWTVSTKPLFLQDGRNVEAQATIRDSDNSILGVVGPDYTPLQNMDSFKFFQPFIDAGLAKLETAGSLDSGKKVWILATLNRDPIVVTGNDIVQKYLLLSNSHDGTRAVRVGFTPVRVVCNNTLTMAHNDTNSQLIRVKHTQNVKANIEDLQKTINAIDAKFEATAEQYRLLASKEINSIDLEKYVKIVLGLDKPSEEDMSTRAKNIIGEVVSIFENSKGSDLVQPKKTLWLAYNSVTEYLQYNKGKDESKRLDSLWFGSNAKVNQVALDEAISMAA